MLMIEWYLKQIEWVEKTSTALVQHRLVSWTTGSFPTHKFQLSTAQVSHLSSAPSSPIYQASPHRPLLCTPPSLPVRTETMSEQPNNTENAMYTTYSPPIFMLPSVIPYLIPISITSKQTRREAENGEVDIFDGESSQTPQTS